MKDDTQPSVPERYVLLCLRVGRHIEGFVDAYFGPPEWKELVDSEEEPAPHALRDEALALLESLAADGLEPDRQRWLGAQLRALDCVLTRMTGDEVPWEDEVERTLGVRPTRTSTDVFQEVHRRLDETLRGGGTLRERYIAWDERNAIPRDKVVSALERLKDALGPQAHAFAPMPDGESVAYEIVSAKPWVAYNWYQGRYRSLIEVNADLPISIALLTDLAAHEAYPGHHTERAAKEAHLVDHLGRAEMSIAIISAPEALISEGIAMNALEQALGSEPYEAVADVLGPLGIDFEPAEVDQVHRAELAFFAVATNAAFLLHEEGAGTAEVAEYLREWSLQSDEKAARTIAFLNEPTSRAYVSAYTDGQRLCRAFAERAAGNFTRLLTEQLTPDDLVGDAETVTA